MASNLSKRPQGTLPSNTKKNPKEEVNAVILRNEKKLEEVEKNLGKRSEKIKDYG